MLQNGQRSKALQKLAAVVGVDADQLQHEFQHHEALALKLSHMGGLSSFEAWKQAVQKQRGGRPEALLAVLARSAGWSASSSTVERGFAHAKALKGVWVEISCAGSCSDFLSASQAPRFT